RVGALDLRRQAPRRFHSDVRVVAEDVHAEPDRRVRDEAADLAEANYAERVTGQLEAGELLLAALDRLVEVAVAVEAFYEFERRAEVARGEQHSRQHQLLHRVGIGARRIEHRDAALRERRYRNVVHPGTRAAHRAQR